MTSLCEKCTGLCCRYFALPLETPDCKKDFDDMRWYLYHEKTSIFIEDDEWYLHIENPCRMLGEDNRCTIYETRPDICRDFDTDTCDFNGEPYGFEEWFKSPEALCGWANKWLEKQFKKKLGKTKAAKKMVKQVEKFGW